MNDLENKKKTATDAEQDYLNTNYGDFKQSQDFADLEEQHRRAGEQAAKDTMGQASARTGGYANSYAISAAQQAQNAHMANLENAARALYDNQKQEKLEKMEVANAIYDRDKAQYEADLVAQDEKVKELEYKLRTANTYDEMMAYYNELEKINPTFANYMANSWENNPTVMRKISGTLDGISGKIIESMKDFGKQSKDDTSEAKPEKNEKDEDRWIFPGFNFWGK